MVHHGLEPADFRQARFRRRHCPAERKVNSAKLSRDERARRSVSRHSHRIHVRCEAALRQSTEEGGHHTYLQVGKWSGHIEQVVRLDANVAVADDQQIVLRLFHQAAQIAHLGTCPRSLDPCHKTYRAFRKFPL